jgi:hypothetical protein
MLAGHVSVQGWTVTVTVKVQSVVLALSLAVQVTVVVPMAKQSPDGGEHRTMALPQLSLAVGVV